MSKKSKEEGKDQESIQSSTMPDPGHIWERDKSTRKRQIHKHLLASPFPAGDHKADRHRQGNMSKMDTKKDLQKK